MKNRSRLLALLIAQAHGLIFYQPSQLRSLRSPCFRRYSINNHVKNDDGAGNSRELDRRGFLGAFGALAVLGPSAVEAAYFADDVGSWRRLPSATEMSRDFAKVTSNSLITEMTIQFNRFCTLMDLINNELKARHCL